VWWDAGFRPGFSCLMCRVAYWYSRDIPSCTHIACICLECYGSQLCYTDIIFFVITQLLSLLSSWSLLAYNPRLHSTIFWQHSPQRGVLSRIHCFRDCDVSDPIGQFSATWCEDVPVVFFSPPDGRLTGSSWHLRYHPYMQWNLKYYVSSGTSCALYSWRLSVSLLLVMEVWCYMLLIYWRRCCSTSSGRSDQLGC